MTKLSNDHAACASTTQLSAQHERSVEKAFAVLVGLWLCLLWSDRAQAYGTFFVGEVSKKELFLREKETRRCHRTKSAPPRSKPLAVLTLLNSWTNESLPVVLSKTPQPPSGFANFLRCHYTNQEGNIDKRIFPMLLRAAQTFKSTVVEIVSAYRAPKYQLFLRKKGHEVARDSEHTRGNAIDFRIPQVATTKLWRFARSLHLGGVGIYPDSQFVHVDVGKARFWRGH